MHTVELNQAFDAELAIYLQQQGLPNWRVIGGSADFAHTEPGYAIETDKESGIKVGIRFRQLAIFWVQQRELYLVHCSSSHQTPMGDWLSRIMR